MLYQKLYDIDRNNPKSISKSLKPIFKFKKRNREEYVKNEIKSLAQENLFILKKILNKNSEYSAKKYEEQYKQSQKYKKMLCHYNSIDFWTSKNNNEPIVQSCNFCSTKKANQKLPKLSFKQKSSFKVFRTTVSRGGNLDERYYKEATRSRKMSSTTRSKFRNTRYDDKNKNGKEASNIDEESNEGSSSDKKISGNGNTDNASGSGSGEGSELNKSKSGGSNSDEGSGNGSGKGSEN
jgi:hypothetical protein